jgi:predicted Rossmann fold nucleotide-binding protein DprA/Smf involved in DNA uptake
MIAAKRARTESRGLRGARSIFSPRAGDERTDHERKARRPVDDISTVESDRRAQQVEVQEALPATDTEADLLRHISKEPVHIDEVCRESGLPASTVSSLLAMMELKGLIRDVGSRAYVRAREQRVPYTA